MSLEEREEPSLRADPGRAAAGQVDELGVDELGVNELGVNWLGANLPGANWLGPGPRQHSNVDPYVRLRRRVGTGRAFPSGTISQGPLHIWDGGGLARPAAPAQPVTWLARVRRPTAGARYPRQSPVSRFLPRLGVSPKAVPVSCGECISTPSAKRRARPWRTAIERFFLIHRTAMIIPTSTLLSTALFTAYPQARDWGWCQTLVFDNPSRWRRAALRARDGGPVDPIRPHSSAFRHFSLRVHRRRIGLCQACETVPGAGAAAFGHDKTRPPPYMGWRGPCSACRTGPASYLARPALRADRRGRTPAPVTGFPVPPTFPEFPPGWRPFPTVFVFLPLCQAPRKTFAGDS